MPLYCAKHLAQLLEEYPPFEYPDEVRASPRPPFPVTAPPRSR